MLKNECARNCWLAAAVFGLLVWIFNGTFIGGLAMGLIAFFLLGNLLVWLVCSGRGGAVEDAEVLGKTPTADPAGDSVLDRAEQAVVEASQAFSAGTVAAVAKGREALQEMRDKSRDDDDDDRREDHEDEDDDDSILERAEEKLEQAGEAVKDAVGAIAARGKEAIDSLKSRDEAAETPVTLAASAPPATVAKPAKKPAVKPKAEKAKTGKPKTEKPKAAKPKKAKVAVDDLKEIKGVGPALETLLHENGVTSFAQIAGWTDAEIDRHAELIGRMGSRIRSDDWVAQAKVLAAGGSTEFSRRVDKGEVY